jgi:hypothetical protein
MINSEPDTDQVAPGGERETAVNAILRSGVTGAIVLAGLATAIVVATWLAFYLSVFVPRAMAP